MRVKELMSTGICCVRPDTSIAEIARQMRKTDVGAIPVCNDKEELLGIITDRDIVLRFLAVENPNSIAFADSASINADDDTLCPSAYCKSSRYYVYKYDYGTRGYEHPRRRSAACASPNSPAADNCRRAACRYAYDSRYCPKTHYGRRSWRHTASRFTACNVITNKYKI